MPDPRTVLMLQMCAGEQAMLRELAASQVTHVDLSSYQPGAEHYERLMRQIEMNRQFDWPKDFTFNL